MQVVVSDRKSVGTYEFVGMVDVGNPAASFARLKIEDLDVFV